MMTPSLSGLLAPLPTPTFPFLEASDERLLQLDALATKERFDLVAEQVEQQMAEGIFDIRPLPYFLYHAFAVGDAAALALVLAAVENLLGPSSTAVGPEIRREEYFNKRLRWLFDKVAASLAYEEKAHSARWRTWSAPESAAAFVAILECGSRVVPLLEAPVFRDAHAALAQLLAFVRHLQERPADPLPQLRGDTSQGAPPGSTRPPAGAWDAKPGTLPMEMPVGPTELSRVELLATAPFVDLCQRLAAFESLVKREQLEKAAIVAADIEERIAAFDPRVHFPALFASFVALHSRHVVSFARYAELTPENAWRALRQYYLVDLRGFTEG